MFISSCPFFNDLSGYKLGCLRKKLPFRLLHYSFLKNFGSVAVLDIDGLLKNYFSSVGYLIYIMHGCARDLYSVVERRLMHF